MQLPVAVQADAAISSVQGSVDTLERSRMERLYVRNQKAALVRIISTSLLLPFVFPAYYGGILRTIQVKGIILTGLCLIALNLPRLWVIKNLIRTEQGYNRFSLLINVLEIIGYTTIMYFLGGVNASFLALIYSILVMYVATVAPKRFSFLLAGFSAIAFLSMIALETSGYLPHQYALASLPPSPQSQLIVGVVVTILLFLTAYVSAFTAERFRSIKNHLKQKNDELEKTMEGMEEVRRKLRQAYDELEKRVEERTSQLRKLTDHLQSEILKREKAQLELKKSEENYRRIFENSVVGFFQSTPAGQFMKVNRAFAKILGYDSPEDLVSSITDISTQFYLNPEDRKIYQNLLAEKGHVENYEIKVRRKDGSIIWISSSTRAYFDSHGNPIRYDGVVIDITERKHSEKEREKLQQQLIQAQKMESVGRLAGGVAHDFNNMLAVIMGHTELVLMKSSPDLPFYNDLVEIRNAAQRSSDLTRQLLAFARKQAIRPRVLDLNETTEGMLKMLRRLIGEEITLAWKPQSQLWPINIDPSQLDQILANLCVNARDAIEGMGTITIETKNITLDQEYCHTHRGASAGDYVMLAVSDTGCGIPEEILNKVFDPFFSTKGPGKGTGLGLSTVYGIVKQNGGYIQVDSKPGSGTTFKIYFPRYRGELETQAKEARQPSPSSNGETILIAEDEPLVLNIMKNVLTELGYNVLPAGHPNEALELARNYPREIHLLITDIVMPHMNGKQLSERVTSLRPNIRTLFMSGYTPEAIIENGIVKDDIYFIQKPFTPVELARMVRNTLEGQTHGPSKQYEGHSACC